MNQIIKPESIDFNKLVSTNTNNMTVLGQSKMIDLLNTEFTQEENRWYIANLYIYMNYHPTNDFPINLDTLVKLVGFSNKQNAKRTLKNNFTNNQDYKNLLIPKDEQVLHGGNNEEKVMLNIDTFKNMCMLVKTKKSKEIRRYYVKLEMIYNKIVKTEIETTKMLLIEKKIELEQKDQLLEQKDIEHTIDLQLDRHKTLLEKFHNKACFYLSKVGENLIKCGSSQDITVRKDDLKRTFGSCLFLDIFECTLYDFREIEQRILCKVKNYLYKEPINGHISKEVVKLNEQTFNYKQLITIVTNEIKNYSNKELDLMKLDIESKKLNLINKLVDKDFTFDQINTLLDFKINQIDRQLPQELINPVIRDKIQIANTIIKRGRKIQVINPDNLNIIVKIYDSMIFALRDLTLNYDKHCIQKAAKCNTIYKGYRWLFVEHGDDFNTVKDIKPTVKSIQPELHVILQLNRDKTEIIESYHGITLIKVKFKVSLLRLNKIINQKLLFNDTFFIKINDCSPELLEKYKEHNNISVRTSSKSKKVKQTNIQTNEEIIYKSITESSIKFGSGEKSIVHAIKTNTTLNGYKFSHLE